MDIVFTEPVWTAVRDLAESEGVKSDTVMKWRQRGDIPAARRLELAAKAPDERVRSALLKTSFGKSESGTANTPKASAVLGG